MSVTSIAVPSLGVANLRYPASVSARILFQEVVTFHARSPGSVQKFIFVIYEKNIYQAFSKEYAQQMSDGAGVPQVSLRNISYLQPTLTISPHPILLSKFLCTHVLGGLINKVLDYKPTPTVAVCECSGLLMITFTFKFLVHTQSHTLCIVQIIYRSSVILFTIIILKIICFLFYLGIT